MASAVPGGASKAGASPLERAPGHHHQACPSWLSGSSWGLQPPTAGPGFLPPPRPGSGPAQLLPPFLVRVPGEAAGVCSLCSCCEALGRAPPQLVCQAGQGAPGPAPAGPSFCRGFQEPLTFRFPWWKPGAVVSGCPLHSLARGPGAASLRTGCGPVPALGRSSPWRDTLRWEPGARQHACLHPGGTEAPGSGWRCGRGSPQPGSEDTALFPPMLCPRPLPGVLKETRVLSGGAAYDLRLPSVSAALESVTPGPALGMRVKLGGLLKLSMGVCDMHEDGGPSLALAGVGDPDPPCQPGWPLHRGGADRGSETF